MKRLIVFLLVAALLLPKNAFAQETSVSAVVTQTQEEVEYYAAVEKLQKTYSTLLAEQKNLPAVAASASIAHPLGMPAKGCTQLFGLDEHTSLPTGFSNIKVITDDPAGASSGNIYYAQTMTNSAQLVFTPDVSSPGVLFYSFDVENTSLLPENMTKLETLNNLTQGGYALFEIPPQSGWTTRVGSMIAKSNEAWILTFSTEQYSLELGGSLKFDNLKVVSCDTETSLLPMVFADDNSPLRCPAGQMGQRMKPSDTVETVANEQYVLPAAISVYGTGENRLACWGRVQTIAYEDGEAVDFFGIDRAVYEGTALAAVALASRNSSMPYWMENIVGQSTAKPTSFGGQFLGKVFGWAVILGIAAEQGYQGYTGYLASKDPKMAYFTAAPTGSFGELLLAHVPHVAAANLTGLVNAYRLKNFPTDEASLKLVLAHTCLAYCFDPATRDGWVITKQTVTGGTLLGSFEYDRYAAMLAQLTLRFQLSGVQGGAAVKEIEKVKVVDNVGDLVDEDEDDLIDFLPPIAPPPGSGGGDDMSKKCFMPIEGMDAGGPNPIGYFLTDLAGHLMSNYRYGVEEQWQRLFDALKDRQTPVELADISYQFQGPPWPIGTQANWAIPLLGVTVTYVCISPKYPDIFPVAAFQLESVIQGVHRLPWRPYAQQ